MPILASANRSARKVGRSDLPGVSPAVRRGLAALEHRRWVGEWPHVRPRTFTEKLMRKTLLDRRPFIIATSDKLAVRDYVEDRIGPHVLPDLLACVDDADELDFDRFPEAFVVKATHGSGWFELVASRETTDLEAVRSEARNWLSQTYDVLGRSWFYEHIPPRVIVEEYLGVPELGPPPDFKFFVMNGRVIAIQMNTVCNGNRRITLYSPEWERLEAQQFDWYPPSDEDAPPPPNLDEMMSIASRLGSETDFVRVDLYDLGNRVVFGEMTHSPAAGKVPFHPASFDEWLGQQWIQPRRYS